ncbi:MAG TPA: hypothetical protein VGM90_14770 [Kofleriaceae bacterium]
MKRVVLLALLSACADSAPSGGASAPLASEPPAVADLSRGMTTELDGVRPAFADAVLAELLGDNDLARANYERVLGDGDVPSSLAARAALHLAQLESRAGNSRKALDLVVRAASLAPGDNAIAEGFAQVSADSGAASGNDNIPGPPPGTTLAGVDAATAKAFAAAERQLVAVHRLRARPVIEALSSSIRAKEAATENTVGMYRAVAAAGGLATVAGHYRAGSLYHDLALGLLFELPPELDANVAAGLRSTLRGRARGYLRKAVAEYDLAVAVPPQPDGELWHLAAETDRSAARGLLPGE